MSDNAAGIPRTRGTLFVVSGPSGSGKNSILALVRQSMPDLVYSISATTRSPRRNEVDGVHYWFISREEFAERLAHDGFLEHAEFCGHLYGTPRAHVEEALASGKDVIMDIETRGAQQVREAMPDAVLIFLMPPSIEELRNRITKRGTESPEVIGERLRKATEEIPLVFRYDYVVLNQNLEEAAAMVRAIILAERSRVAKCDCAAFICSLSGQAKDSGI